MNARARRGRQTPVEPPHDGELPVVDPLAALVGGEHPGADPAARRGATSRAVTAASSVNFARVIPACPSPGTLIEPETSRIASTRMSVRRMSHCSSAPMRSPGSSSGSSVYAAAVVPAIDGPFVGGTRAEPGLRDRGPTLAALQHGERLGGRRRPGRVEGEVDEPGVVQAHRPRGGDERPHQAGGLGGERGGRLLGCRERQDVARCPAAISKSCSVEGAAKRDVTMSLPADVRSRASGRSTREA